ncbi:phage adaptor protein [Solimonas marina]|uniref:Uncharacterized protein n=1 Tax=Solimonas marina TaxID=2714601 RepID=A0A970B3S6_9GAMM|nr:DUF6682 family protein [Solimonas marina]NKF21577.1 hypothetical protein [Solimonas marina]
MKLPDLLTELRVLLDDSAAPYLWADEQLVTYLNESVDEACIRAFLIYDESSELAQLTAAANTATAPLSKLVIAVDKVYAGARKLERTTSDELDNEYGGRWRTMTGQPCRFYEEEAYIRPFPTPTTDTDLALCLWRLPTEPMSLNDTEAEPEINPAYHPLLLDWAAHLAFKRRDADANDRQRAADHAALFTASFGERPDANVRRKRRLKKVPVCRPHW